MAMWMVYAAAVAALLAGGGFALERICEARGWPLRFVWLAALTLAVVLPMNADPPEPVRDSPTHAADMAQTAPLAGNEAELPPAAPADDRRGESGALASFASRAPLIGWGLASLVALAMLATVLLASASAQRRWERRRIGSEDVYVSHRFGPALVGIARPAVVIPRWVLRLGRAVGDRVVAHEREHARAGDHLVLLYAGLILVAFPWNPAIWWMCRRLRAAVEIDCDRRVIASGIPASEYGSLLLGIGTGRRGGWLFALRMADSGSLLERRLRTMSGSRRRMGAPTATLLAVLTIGSITLACDIPAPAGIAPVVGEVLGMRGEPPTGEQSRSSDPKAIGYTGQVPRIEDGRTVIRGRDWSPYLVLDSATVAANPLVLLDDQVVEGGLTSLMPMMHTLDFARVGMRGARTAVRMYGERAAGGAVLIWTRGSVLQSTDRAWGQFADRWEMAESPWVNAEPAWQRAERELEAAERQLQAPVHGPEALDPATGVLERATGPDGRLYIRDRTGTASLVLGAELAARDPRVELDGRVLRGGLRSLLPMMDTLDIASIGHFGVPPRVVVKTVGREGSR